MARIDFRTLKRMPGRDGVVRPIGTIIKQEEWASWHNAGAYVDQHQVEVLIDGETVPHFVAQVIAKALHLPKPVAKVVSTVVEAAVDAVENVVEDAADAVDKALHPRAKRKG